MNLRRRELRSDADVSREGRDQLSQRGTLRIEVPRLLTFGQDDDGGADDGLARTEALALALVVEGDAHRPAAGAVSRAKASRASIAWITENPLHRSHRLSVRRC